MNLSPIPIRPAVALIPVLVVIGLAGCGGGSGTSSTGSDTTAASQSGADSAAASAGPQTVDIKGFAFAPADLTVAKGTTIEFPNEDETPHTATSKTAGAFDTGSIKPGASGKVTLNKAGTFDYYCQFHPFMTGTITVE